MFRTKILLATVVGTLLRFSISLLSPAPKSVYIHIPFCRRRCYYCDFPIKVVGDRKNDAEKASESYVDVVKREILATKDILGANWVPNGGLDTIYFGGGTPSLCPPNLIFDLITMLNQEFGIANSAEISIEMDPGTFDGTVLKKFLGAGITRINMGVQSFEASLLEACGRAHTVQDVYRAVDLLHNENFLNFGLDLIGGLPNQSMDQWERSIDSAVDTGAVHVSIYDLQVEENTAFGRWYTEGKSPLPKESTSANMFRLASRKLSSAGYNHYEISNYSKPGNESRHNIAYWKNRLYFGFGNGAASHINHTRFTRPRGLPEYKSWVDDLELDRNWEKSTTFEPYDSKSIALDTLMLGMRVREGVDLEKLGGLVGEKWVKGVLNGAKESIDKGLVSFSGGMLSLTDPEGMLFSNNVISDIFAELGATGE